MQSGREDYVSFLEITVEIQERLCSSPIEDLFSVDKDKICFQFVDHEEKIISLFSGQDLIDLCNGHVDLAKRLLILCEECENINPVVLLDDWYNENSEGQYNTLPEYDFKRLFPENRR